MIEVR